MSAATEAPADEAALAELIAAAAASGTPLAIEGAGVQRASLRPVQAARTVSTRALTGITFYRPDELVLSARAGTPLPEIEAALAERGQMLPPEPPHLGALFGTDAAPTIGGLVAANLSGPRRISAGALRDSLLGIRMVNGRGQVIRSGGRVLKNVTGLDLCKLLAGSHGTLGVLTEVTLKVLPVAEASVTLAVRVADLAAGVAVLSAGLGSPYGVTGAAILPVGPVGGPEALLRLEDFDSFLPARVASLRAAVAPRAEARVLDDAASRAVWAAIREAEPLHAALDDAVWRVSVPPSAGPGVAAALLRAFDARLLLDWGGGLVWVAGPATNAAHDAVVAAARAGRGGHTLFRAPEPLRAAVAVIPEEPAPLAALSRRVKAAIDPAGVCNPGRMRAGL